MVDFDSKLKDRKELLERARQFQRVGHKQDFSGMTNAKLENYASTWEKVFEDAFSEELDEEDDDGL